MRWTQFVSALGRVGRWNVAWLIIIVIAVEFAVAFGFGFLRGLGIGLPGAGLWQWFVTAPVVEETIRWAIGVGRSGDDRTQGLIWFTTVAVLVELLNAAFVVVEPLKDHPALVITVAILVLRGPATAFHIVNSWLVSRYADGAVKGPSLAPFATIGLHAAINTFAILYWGPAIVRFLQRA